LSVQNKVTTYTKSLVEYTCIQIYITPKNDLSVEIETSLDDKVDIQ